MEEQIAVIGLGYVGLPGALAFARKFKNTVGFDVSAARFDDARPGSVYRVRVEARDPAHDDPSTLRDLEGCGDDRICERPPRCVRWVGWKVQLR